MNIFLRILPRAFLGALISLNVFGFAAFDSFPTPSDAAMRDAYAAVVFTGQFERVDAGLRLLSKKEVPRLYISGLNWGAGIKPANFVNQFSERNPQIMGLQRLVNCCVEWGELADTTFQNARETECWAKRRRVTAPLLLITSKQHMARALAALTGRLPRLRIIPYPVQDTIPPLTGEARRLEYVAFLATLVAVRLPLWGDALDIYGPFAKGCPESS